MKVTNGDIWFAHGGPQEQPGPMAKLTKEKWPVKPCYWLARLASQIEKDFGPIEQTRMALVNKYGEPSPDGNGIIVSREKAAEFSAELDELFAIETEIEGINPIVLPDVEGVTLEPATLMALEVFIAVTD